MFESWKVGQMGWVRLRNGKVGMAIRYYADGSKLTILVLSIADDGLRLRDFWCDTYGAVAHASEDGPGIAEHLPDCTGFDWDDDKEIQVIELDECNYKAGDWIRVVSHRDELWPLILGEHPIGQVAKIKEVQEYNLLALEGDFMTGVWPDMVEPHQWKVGDWFVVDEKHGIGGTVKWPAWKEVFVGKPQVVEYVGAIDLKANGYWWDQSWCRPCDPPKAEPTRFQPSIEYVGIHDAI